MSRHSFKRLLADLNWCFYSGVGVVAIFSCFSFSNFNHYVVELLRNFPVQYFIVGLLSLLWSVVSVNKRGILLSLVVVGLNYIQIKDYPLTFFRCCEGVAGDSFRAMSVNVLTSNLRKGELLERVKKHSPDVISFLEVNSEWLLEIESSIGVEYPHHVEFPRPDNFGIALRSKFPIVKAKIDALGERQPETIVADLVIMGKVVRVVATHPVPPMSSENNSLNNQQLKAIADLVLENRMPTIIMGDLNSTPWGAGFKI
jgi:endonuclease/exonuclease/phosphatase (EEP) superfamily protein YafD